MKFVHRLTAIFLLSIISLTGLAQNNTIPADWKSFTDTAGYFTARYPANWVNKIKAGNRVFFTSPAESDTDNFYENINIGVTFDADFGVKYKIRDVYPDVIEQLKGNLNDFVLETQRYFNWNKTETCEIIYTGYSKQDESRKVRIKQWFCFYKMRLYTITYTSDASNTIYTEPATMIMNSIFIK